MYLFNIQQGVNMLSSGLTQLYYHYFKKIIDEFPMSHFFMKLFVGRTHLVPTPTSTPQELQISTYLTSRTVTVLMIPRTRFGEFHWKYQPTFNCYKKNETSFAFSNNRSFQSIRENYFTRFSDIRIANFTYK